MNLIVNKYPKEKYPDLKDVKIDGPFVRRKIDIFKYYEVFGVELEKDTDPFTDRKITFWAWRAYNFFCKLSVDDEILLSDFCAMYSSDEVDEFIKRVFNKIDDKKTKDSRGA